MKNLKRLMRCSGCPGGIVRASDRRFFDGRVVCRACLAFAKFADEFRFSPTVVKLEGAVARAVERLRRLRAA